MSPDEFRELLQSKGATAQCPVCGAEDWRGLDDVIDLPVRVAGAGGHATHVRIPGFEALAPSCGRCGHVHLIDLALLRAPAGQDVEPGPKPPAEAHEPPDTDQAKPRRRRREPVTNIWGDPVSKRKDKKG